jgi:exosome complex exonuclease RRP6
VKKKSLKLESNQRPLDISHTSTVECSATELLRVKSKNLVPYRGVEKLFHLHNEIIAAPRLLSMRLLDLSADFVRKINSLLAQPEASANIPKERLVGRISAVQSHLQSAEEIVCRTIAAHKKRSGEDRIVYITKSSRPVCIIGERTLKPAISEIDAEAVFCACSLAFVPFKQFTSAMYVESEPQLMEIDGTVSQAAIEVFEHSYRSYRGFACFLSVGDTNGNIYIIDAIRFREAVARLRLLKCSIPKIIHCRECVRRLHRDFKQLGCYRNYSLASGDIYIDWRIRPADAYMLQVLQNGVFRIAELHNKGERAERYEAGAEEELDGVEELLGRCNLRADRASLGRLLKLRRFLARSNNESEQYILTDAQAAALLRQMPRNTAELLGAAGRLSPIAKQHSSDLVMALEERKSFSIERLKRTGRRSRKREQPKTTDNECESSLSDGGSSLDLEALNMRQGEKKMRLDVEQGCIGEIEIVKGSKKKA